VWTTGSWLLLGWGAAPLIALEVCVRAVVGEAAAPLAAVRGMFGFRQAGQQALVGAWLAAGAALLLGRTPAEARTAVLRSDR
jgi:hypothetical protein